MEISIDKGQFVYVPVPSGHFAEVLVFLNQLLAASSSAAPGGEEEDLASGDSEFWTSERLGLLRSQLRYQGAKQALDLAAREAPRPVPITQVELETPSRSAREVAADLGALTKLCRKLFGRKAWPMRAMEMWAKDEDKWCMHYVMSSEVADRWKSLPDASATKAGG